MAILLDFKAGQDRRRARLEREGQSGPGKSKIPSVDHRTIPYPPAPPRPTEAAKFYRLQNKNLVDGQIHAALRHVFQGVSGFWVLTYNPIVMNPGMMPSDLPQAARFIDENSFFEKFVPSRMALKQNLKGHFASACEDIADQIPQLFHRHLFYVDRVTEPGPYWNRGFGDSDIQLKCGDMVFHHSGYRADLLAPPEFVSKSDATLRLRVIQPDGSLQRWEPPTR